MDKDSIVVESLKRLGRIIKYPGFFYCQMIGTLFENQKEKGDSWMECELHYLFDKLRLEFDELFDEDNIEHINFGDTTIIDKEQVQHELVDVANMCMMTWNRLEHGNEKDDFIITEREKNGGG